MKNKILKFMVLILLVVAFVSCNEDFLDIKPQASENTAAFYQNMLHADQAVIACYSQFNNTSAWDRLMIMGYGEINSDDTEAGGEYVNEVPELESISRLNPNSTGSEFDEVYGTMYRAINFANIAIERLPSIADTDPDADIVLLNKRIAEAKFIRAINHFYLSAVFGEVPIIDHVLGPSEYQMGRSNLRDIYDLIEKDLTEAMAVLPEKGGWNGEEGRATKGACQALLAKMCLYESSYAKYYAGQDERYILLNERWADVIKWTDEVIKSGKYRLIGIDGETYDTWRGPETDGYRYLFSSAADYCDESIFEITTIWEGLDNYDARGQSLTKWTGARQAFDENGKSISTNFWGLALPSYHMVELFDDGDPRLRTSIGWEGGDCPPIQIKGGTFLEISYINSVTNTYQRKWECSAAEFQDVSSEWYTAPSNVKLIRLSDMYLMAAEAALNLGQNDKALDNVNKVRERARNCGDTGQPEALTSVTMDDIRKERRLEFCGEGHRMFDIVRWNIASEVLNTPTTDGYERNFVKGKNEYWPIPQREIDLSGGAIQQYTAY